MAVDGRAAAVAAEFANLTAREQSSIAERSEVQSVDAMLSAEKRSLAQAARAVHDAKRAHAEKARALADKADKVGQMLAFYQRYVLAVCIQLELKRIELRIKAWCGSTPSLAPFCPQCAVPRPAARATDARSRDARRASRRISTHRPGARQSGIACFCRPRLR